VPYPPEADLGQNGEGRESADQRGWTGMGSTRDAIQERIAPGTDPLARV